MKEPQGYQDICSNIFFSSYRDVILNGFRGRKASLTVTIDNDAMAGKNIKAELDFYLALEDLYAFSNHALHRDGTIQVEDYDINFSVRVEATVYITKANLEKISKYVDTIVHEPSYYAPSLFEII